KLLTELRLKKADITIQPQSAHPLDEWYGHVFTLYPRRKCVVFAHAGTMFCFFAMDVSREDINSIEAIFRQRLRKALYDEHYPAEVIGIFNERMKEIRVTSTLDRVMIGTINRMVIDLGYFEGSDRRMMKNEAIMGAYFRRGCYLAFRGGPLKNMRDVLAQLNEIKGMELPAPLSDESISQHFGVSSIYH
ncbi:MAG: hypothetical protein KGK03_07990, partial [Candidatus Omnitrophica bacterium]|nr:hypothetical protein [Candidatus Omnitrophota bacterium]